jgi:hypothetical protein
MFGGSLRHGAIQVSDVLREPALSPLLARPVISPEVLQFLQERMQRIDALKP